MLLDKIPIYTTRKFVENGVTDRSLCKTVTYFLSINYYRIIRIDIWGWGEKMMELNFSA